MPADAPLVSLDHLTLFELAPPALVDVAAAAGFDRVGLRLRPAAPGERQHPMLGDTPMRRETLARLRDRGVAVFDFGVLRLRRDIDAASYEPVLESAAVLGARHAVVNGDESDVSRAAQLLLSLCELGRRYGVRMHLEPTPWSAVPTPSAALAVVEASGDSDACVLVDPIHVDRAGTTIDALRALPRERVRYVQLCDAIGPRPSDFETMIFQARHARAFPGEGTLDVVGMLAALPAVAAFSVEVPLDALAATLSPLQRAARARRAVDALLARVAQDRDDMRKP